MRLDGAPFSPNRPIFISGFHGAWLSLDVKKKAGRESEELLAEETAKPGLWDSVRGLFKKEEEKAQNDGILFFFFNL